jgi:hypothetical protein
MFWLVIVDLFHHMLHSDKTLSLKNIDWTIFSKYRLEYMINRTYRTSLEELKFGRASQRQVNITNTIVL